MSTQAELLKLVDLALCHPEKGAVNFNHLRKLLLEILKLLQKNSLALLRLDNPARHKVRAAGKDNLSTKDNNVSRRSDSSGAKDQTGSHSHQDKENTRVVKDKIQLEIKSDKPEQSIDAIDHATEENEKSQQNVENEALDEVQVKSGEEDHEHDEGIGGMSNQTSEDNIVTEVDGAANIDGGSESCIIDMDGVNNGDNDQQTLADKIDMLMSSQRDLDRRLQNIEDDLSKFNKFPDNRDILSRRAESLTSIDEDYNDGKDGDKPVSQLGSRPETRSNSRPVTPGEHLGQVWQSKKISHRLDMAEEGIDKLFSLMKDLIDENSGHSKLKDIDGRFQKIEKDLEINKTTIDNISERLKRDEDILEENKQKVEQNKTNMDSNKENIERNKEKIDNNSEIIEKHGDNIEINKENIETLTNKVDSYIETNKENIENLTNKVDLLSDLVESEENKASQNMENIANQKEELDKLKEHLDQVRDSIAAFISGKSDRSGVTIEEADLLKTLQASQFRDILEELNSLKGRHEQLNERQEALYKMLGNMKGPPPEAYDASVVAAIQNLAHNNRQQIAAVQAEISLLKTLMKSQPKEDGTSKSPLQYDQDSLENFVKLLTALQEEQMKLSANVTNVSNDMKDEFYRKQQHIDALYDYIEKLQNNKADKDDVNLEMDVKADKKALDGKVSLSTFDERYQMLEQALDNALARLDHYVQNEATMNDALMKLNEELQSKMNSDAEKKLKRFFEERLKEMQKSRTEPAPQANLTCDLRNAAGFRTPVSLMYHCISCDRPIDLNMRGTHGPVVNNFPGKRSLGPYKTFELDQLRQNTKPNSYFFVNRHCGGQHTSRNLKPNLVAPAQTYADTYNVAERPPDEDPFSVAECVVGKDGQIYRGRFKPGDVPVAPKKYPVPVARLKYSKYRNTHSAHCDKPPTAAIDDRRPRSAFEAETNSNGPIVLPPISREVGTLINGDPVNSNEDEIKASTF